MKHPTKNMQDLWSYMMLCPKCNTMTRDINLSSGPEGVFRITAFKKKDQFLFLNGLFKAKKVQYKCNYKINCLNNSFTIDVSDPILLTNGERFDKASVPYFFFYLYANCTACHCCHISSNDIEFNILSSLLTGTDVQEENVYLNDKKYEYVINISYIEDKISVSKSKILSDNSDVSIDIEKVFELPLMEIDYTNTEKAINKIKTLLVFT